MDVPCTASCRLYPLRGTLLPRYAEDLSTLLVLQINLINNGLGRGSESPLNICCQLKIYPDSIVDRDPGYGYNWVSLVKNR